MKFTDEELFEIEKLFDLSTSQITSYLADLISKLNPIDNPKAMKLCDKLLKEATNSFDLYRTISAKCQQIRGDRVLPIK